MWLLSTSKDKQAAKELFSHLDLFSQITDTGFLQTLGFLGDIEFGLGLSLPGFGFLIDCSI